MIADQLLTTLPREAMEDSNTFRTEMLYTKACDNVLQVQKIEEKLLSLREPEVTSNAAQS